MMNLTTGAPFSYGQLVGQAIGVALLGALLAALLAGLLHRALNLVGAWRMRPGAGQKFSWWFAVMSVGLAAVAGGGTVSTETEEPKP